MWSNELAQRAVIGVGFGVVAALSRHTAVWIETRIQILVFIILAAIYEWALRPTIGQRPQLVGLAINAALAAAAILATRWHLEGLCPGVIRAGCLPFV
jgi:hypothetical protein